jgi:hypothetical protein
MDGLDKYRAVGRRAGLLMAVAGTVVAVTMLTMMGMTREFGEDRMVSAGFLAIMACTIVLGWGLGGAFGMRIARGANPWLWGVLLAFLTVIGTVILMSIGIAVVLVVAGRGIDCAHLVMTLVWMAYVLLFGAVPILALGLGYGAMLQRLRNRA